MLFGLAAVVADWAGRVETPSPLSDSWLCEVLVTREALLVLARECLQAGLVLVCSCSSGSQQSPGSSHTATCYSRHTAPRPPAPHRHQRQRWDSITWCPVRLR